MFKQECYCAQYKGVELIDSTSGGVFFAFAKYFIEHGGCVYGAAFCDFPHLKHICVDKIQDLKKLQGSKYLESEFSYALPEIKGRVENGQLVLFSGTPCQIAAVRSFLKEDSSNILFIDILCHGTPSKNIFLEYIKWREKKWNTKILNFEFRNKHISEWGGEQKALISTSMGEKIIPAVCDPYFSAFQKGLIAQKRCYVCKYAAPNRVGDITAADFWGIRILRPNFPYAKGASCLLVNTSKGKSFFENLKKDFLLEEMSFDDARKYNPHFNRPLKFNSIQNEIYSTLAHNKGFSSILSKIPYQAFYVYLIKKYLRYVRNFIRF